MTIAETELKVEANEVRVKGKPGKIQQKEQGEEKWLLEIPLKFKVGPFQKRYGTLTLADLELDSNNLKELQNKEMHFLHQPVNRDHAVRLNVDDEAVGVELLHTEFFNAEENKIGVRCEVIIDFENTSFKLPSGEFTIESELELQ